VKVKFGEHPMQEILLLEFKVDLRNVGRSTARGSFFCEGVAGGKVADGIGEWLKMMVPRRLAEAGRQFIAPSSEVTRTEVVYLQDAARPFCGSIDLGMLYSYQSLGRPENRTSARSFIIGQVRLDIGSVRGFWDVGDEWVDGVLLRIPHRDIMN
jgi:hypothetical protein